jgi:uncharacterized protein YceK
MRKILLTFVTCLFLTGCGVIQSVPRATSTPMPTDVAEIEEADGMIFVLDAHKQL